MCLGKPKQSLLLYHPSIILSIGIKTGFLRLSKKKQSTAKSETADIRFVPSGDGMCRVVCCEAGNAKHTVSVQNGTLTVRVVDERKRYEYIGIMLNPQTVTVYLPEDAYAALQIQTGTGRTEIPASFQFQSFDISANTGDIRVPSSVTGGKCELIGYSHRNRMHANGRIVSARKFSISAGLFWW